MKTRYFWVNGVRCGAKLTVADGATILDLAASAGAVRHPLNEVALRSVSTGKLVQPDDVVNLDTPRHFQAAPVWSAG